MTPLPLLTVLVVFVITVAVTRYISLGSVLAAGFFPASVYLIDHPPTIVVTAAAIAGAFIVWRHMSNLKRIREGNENVFSLGGRRP